MFDSFLESINNIKWAHFVSSIGKCTVEQSNLEACFREQLWDSHANGFHDAATIKVEEQELKLCYIKNRLNLLFSSRKPF